MFKLTNYLKHYKAQIILGPFFKLLEAILELINPLLVAKIIDVGIKNNDLHYILKFGVIILVCNLFGLIFAIICQKCASLTSVGVATKIREDMYKSVNNFSHAELDKFGTHSLVNRLTNDTSQLQDAVSLFIRTLMRTPCLLIGSIILAVNINKKLSLIFLVVFPILCVMLVIYTKLTMPKYKEARVKLDDVSRVTREDLSGARVIRAFNKEQQENERFKQANHSLVKTSLSISKISSFLDPFILLIVDFAVIAVLYFGGIEINVGAITQGELIAFSNYLITISVSLIQASDIYVMVIRTTASAHRIAEVINTSSSIKYLDAPINFRTRQDSPIIEFKNVGFAYDKTVEDVDRMFLKNVSFSIYPNQTIGIIGSTGSGKTTLINLIARFYDCNAGQINLFGKNIKDYPKEQLRNIISVAQQRASLFSGSLRENMQLRDRNASDKQIINALKVAQAWDFVSLWSQKLNYQIMAGGKNVSGGQMQRLAIARSLIGNPRILILDDSFSALDFLTDAKLRKSLKTLNCTSIIVSQRVSTIKNADLIIVMDNGDIVGMGKHSQLMNKCDVYRETYKSQTQKEV